MTCILFALPVDLALTILVDFIPLHREISALDIACAPSVRSDFLTLAQRSQFKLADDISVRLKDSWASYLVWLDSRRVKIQAFSVDGSLTYADLWLSDFALSHVERIHFCGDDIDADICHSVLRRCRSMVSLSFGGCLAGVVTEVLMTSLHKSLLQATSLKEFQYLRCNLSEKLRIVACLCDFPDLVSIQLSFNDDADSDEEEDDEWGDQDTLNLAASHRNLSRLSIAECSNRMTHASFTTIMTHCPRIMVLELDAISYYAHDQQGAGCALVFKDHYSPDKWDIPAVLSACTRPINSLVIHHELVLTANTLRVIADLAGGTLERLSMQWGCDDDEEENDDEDEDEDDDDDDEDDGDEDEDAEGSDESDASEDDDSTGDSDSASDVDHGASNARPGGNYIAARDMMAERSTALMLLKHELEDEDTIVDVKADDEVEVLKYLAAHLLCLQTLKVLKSTLRTKLMAPMATLPKLSSLEFAYCEISSISLRQVLENCGRRLVNLNFIVSDNLSSDTLVDIVQHCPHLQTLGFDRCEDITGPSIRKAIIAPDHLKDLKVLKFAGEGKISMNGVAKRWRVIISLCEQGTHK